MKKEENAKEEVLSVDNHVDTEQDIKNDEQIKEAISKATPQDILESYLKDPVVKQNLINTSLDFLNLFRGNWFTLEQVMKKSQFKDQTTAIQLMQMMIFSDLCVTKNENGTQKFKIVLSLEDKINSLQKQIEQLDLKKKLLQAEIDRLNEKNVN